MPITFSAQELTYAATALRAASVQTRARANDPAMNSSRQVFLQAADAAEALSQKFDDAAKEMEPAPAT